MHPVPPELERHQSHRPRFRELAAPVGIRPTLLSNRERVLLKWALMAAVLFWTMVFKQSELQIRVPDFVYANF